MKKLLLFIFLSLLFLQSANADPINGVQGLSLFDNTDLTWRHIRNSKTVAADNDGSRLLPSGCYLFSRPNTQWTQCASANFNESSPDPDGTFAVGKYLATSTSWVKERAGDQLTADNQSLSQSPAGGILGFGGTSGWDRIRTTQAAIHADVSTASLNGVLYSTQGPTETRISTPAVNVQATQFLSAVGDRSVVTGVHGCIRNNSGSGVSQDLNLRITAGSTLMKWHFDVPPGSSKCIDLNNLAISGISGDRFTLEFDAASGANTFQTVTIQGYGVEG